MASATSRSAQNRLLAALPRAELERYFSELRPVSLIQRQVLYEPGAPLTHVYFVNEGVVSILTKMADATTIEVGMIGIEGAVGTAALLGGETSSQQALVQVAGSALRMNAAECKAAFDQSPAVRAVMISSQRAHRCSIVWSRLHAAVCALRSNNASMKWRVTGCKTTSCR